MRRIVLNNSGTARAYGCLSTSFSRLERDTRRGGAFSLYWNSNTFALLPFRETIDIFSKYLYSQWSLNSDGFVKSPSATLRFTVQGLNVQKVRLALSRLARLAYEPFHKAVDNVFFKVSNLAIYKE